VAIIYPHRRNLSAKELNWSQLWSLIRWTRVFWIGTALLDRLLFYPERRHLSRLTVPIQFADALRPHGHGMCLRLLGNGVIPQRHPHGHGACTHDLTVWARRPPRAGAKVRTLKRMKQP